MASPLLTKEGSHIGRGGTRRARIADVDQMPNSGPFQNVQLHVYLGGHMFCARADSGRAFKRDAMRLYEAR